MLPIQPVTLTLPRWVYRIMLCIFALYVIYLLQQPHISRKDYGGIVMASIACVICYLYMIRIKVHLDNDGITDYKMLGKTFIQWSEITAADITIASHGHGMSPVWVLERRQNKPYNIEMPKNMKNFRIFAEALVMRAPDAKLSNKIIKLSEGQKVSIFFD